MRERLTERIGDGIRYDNGEYIITCYPKNNNLTPVDKLAVKLCDLEDKIESGAVIVPPCKVGDTVYEVEKQCLGCLYYSDGGYSDFCECTLDDNKLMFECDFDKECVYKIIPKRFTYGMIEHFGKTVFLTREEAEKALKGGAVCKNQSN